MWLLSSVCGANPVLITSNIVMCLSAHVATVPHAISLWHDAEPDVQLTRLQQNFYSPIQGHQAKWATAEEDLTLFPPNAVTTPEGCSSPAIAELAAAGDIPWGYWDAMGGGTWYVIWMRHHDAGITHVS